MAAAAGMWEKAYIVRMWDELDQLWTNFRDQKLDQNFKQVSSCARSLDPGPLSRLRNEGFSANTCFSRPPHAPGHIEMILAFQTFRAEPEKKIEFSACLTRFFPLRNPSRFRPGVPRGSGRLQCRRRRRRQRHSLHCLQVAKAGFGLSAILGELVLSA